MKRYVLCTKYDNKNVKRIQKRFYSMFGVDLCTERYKSGKNFEENWEQLIKDVFRRQTRGDSEKLIEEFMLLVNFLAHEKNRDGIIRGEDDYLKKWKENHNKLNEIVSTMLNLSEDYYLLESDIYMNAYLSIKYIEAMKSNKKDLDTKGIIVADKDNVVKVKDRQFTFPFKLMKDKDFCLQYQKSLFRVDKVDIFSTKKIKKIKKEIIEEFEEDEEGYSKEIDIEEKEIDINELYDFCGYKKRIEVFFPKDWICERWSRKYILDIEQKLQMEDKILFYKTINGILPRNMVDLMIISKRQMNVYDYLYLIDWLCTCNSVKWKNLIGIITVYTCIYQDTLKEFHVWDDVQFCIDVWISQIRTINRRMQCLTNALIHMAYSTGNIEYIRDKCKKEIDELGKFPQIYEKICEENKDKVKLHYENIWKNQPDKLRAKTKVLPTDYGWIYAILQWRIIDNIRLNRGRILTGSAYSLGYLIYLIYCMDNKSRRILIEQKRLYIKEPKDEKIKELIKKIGGIQGLINISNDVFLTIIEKGDTSGKQDDFFQLLDKNEQAIQKMFCNKVYEKGEILIKPESDEIKGVRNYMATVLDVIDDIMKFPTRDEQVE